MKKARSWWIYLLIFFISQVTSAGLMILVPVLSGHKVDPSMTGWMMGSALFIANVLAIVLFCLFRPRSITWPSTIAGVKGHTGYRTLLMFLLALPLIFLINIIQEAFFPELPDLVGDEQFKAIMYNPLGLITVSLIGPLSEELLFRGGIQTDVQTRYASQGPAVAIGLSAVIFALIHMNPAQMPAALILGIVLGFAYWWTGSLAAPIFIHVFNNSFACVMGLLSPDEDSFIQFIGGREAAAIVSVVCVFFLYFALRAVRKEGLKGTEIS